MSPNTTVVRRYHAPTVDRRADYFYAECDACPWMGNFHSNRTLAERDAARHVSRSV